MAIHKIKAGGTFSKAGIVKKLDPSVAWGAACSLVDRDTRLTKIAATVTFAKATDWTTSGNWNISVYLPQATTLTMGPLTADQVSRVWEMDVKFFDTANPDPVIFTETIQLAAERTVS